MDGSRFDRIARALAPGLPRRAAVKAFAGSGVAAVGARLGFEETAAGKKKRCRKRRKSCGGRKKCCGQNTACRSYPTQTCATLSGRRCCGLEGAPCGSEPTLSNCDCCDGLFCGGPVGQPRRCQEEPV